MAGREPEENRYVDVTQHVGDRLADHLLLESVLAGDGLAAALEVRRDRVELSVHVLVPAEMGEA